MFVFDIVNKLAKDHQAKKASQVKGLNGLQISTKPTISELWAKAKTGSTSDTTNIDVTVSGYSRTIGSEVLQKTSTLGLGYGIGKAVATPDATPANFGAENNDLLLLLWAPLTSFLVGELLQDSVFDKMLGSKLPKTTFSVSTTDWISPTSADFKKKAVDMISIEDDKDDPALQAKYAEYLINEAKATSFDAVYSPLHALSCAYHGYQRHGESILAGLGWLLFGNLGLAAAQGYGKPLRRKAKGSQVESLRPNEQVYASQGAFKFNTEPQITLVKSNPMSKASKKKKKPTSTRALKKAKPMSATKKAKPISTSKKQSKAKKR